MAKANRSKSSFTKANLPPPGMMLLILFGLGIQRGKTADINSNIHHNQLRFGYGVNFKYSGKVYQNLEYGLFTG